MSYHIGSQGIVAIPIYVRHMLSLKETATGSGRLDITVGPKQTLGRTVSVQCWVQIPIFFFVLKIINIQF